MLSASYDVFLKIAEPRLTQLPRGFLWIAEDVVYSKNETFLC